MTPSDLSNNQLLQLIAMFLGLAIVFGGLIIYVMSGGFKGRGKSHKKKNKEGISFNVDMANAQTTDSPQLANEFLDGESNKPADGLLKSGGLLKSSQSLLKPVTHQPTATSPDQSMSTEINQNRSLHQEAAFSAGAYQEVLRILADPESGDVVIEVDGQKYDNLKKIKDQSVGRRILESVALLLNFTNGRVASQSGLQAFPVPDVKLTPLPSKSPNGGFTDNDVFGNSVNTTVPNNLEQRLDQLVGAPSPKAPQLTGSEEAQQTNQPSASVPPSVIPSVSPPIDTGSGRRGLLGLGGATKEPDLPAFSLADEINNIVQRSLVDAGIQTPIKVTSGIDGLLQINVAGRFFNAVDDVEPPHVKEIIQSAIKEWEKH